MICRHLGQKNGTQIKIGKATTNNQLDCFVKGTFKALFGYDINEN